MDQLGSVFEDNFCCPAEWDEESKRAYTEWLARQSETHPCKSYPRPWDRD